MVLFCGEVLKLCPLFALLFSVFPVYLCGIMLVLSILLLWL